MQTINVSFEAFKKAFPDTGKVFAVTSTQWIDEVGNQRIVDIYAVKSGYLMQTSIQEKLLDDYKLINNAEMGDGVAENAISNAIEAGL